MKISASSRRSTLLSALLHGAAVLALLAAWRLHPITVVPRAPGSSAGTRVTLFYQRGGQPAPAVSAAVVPPPRPKPVPVSPPAPKLTAAIRTPAPPAPVTPTNVSGAGSSGEASLGDGDIRIALVQLHPRPNPDLSSLPHGAAGDVILNATIDAQGRIAGLTVTRSLSPAIDKDVIATVQGWTFSPATRNGVPTASEQQILFHYERS